MPSRYTNVGITSPVCVEPRIARDDSVSVTPLQHESLFKHLPRGSSNGQGAFRDPAFVDNKSLPLHRWVPWIAGYSAPFVDDVITAYLPQQKTALVLDPFCGVGTTLLQSVLRGYDTIGLEINPYASLAARAKLSAPMIDLASFDAFLENLETHARLWKTIPVPVDITPPPLKSRLPFFSPAVEKQVLHALNFLHSIASESLANLYRIAFGAVMVSVSNYTYEPSLGSRPAAGKPLITEADVGDVLLMKLRQMHADVVWVQEQMRGRRLGTGRVINADFFSAQEHLETDSVHLMVTSPPYMNNYHYVRNTRPQLYWLNFITSPKEQKHLETNNFGQYWQTVRDSMPIPLVFAHSGLVEILQQLRATRAEQGAYGGPGWANYVTAYFNDCYRFMATLKRVLACRGVGVVVIGNSIIQGFDIRTEELLGEIGVMQGLTLEGVHCIRDKRVGASITQSSVRQGTRSKATLSEFAVVVRKA
jgi:hypothetical protein